MKINLQDASLLRPSIAARMLLFQAEIGSAGFTVRYAWNPAYPCKRINGHAAKNARHKGSIGAQSESCRVKHMRTWVWAANITLVTCVKCAQVWSGGIFAPLAQGNIVTCLWHTDDVLTDDRTDALISRAQNAHKPREVRGLEVTANLNVQLETHAATRTGLHHFWSVRLWIYTTVRN